MNDNTARVTEDPEWDRPTLIPGGPITSRENDTSALDAAWPEAAPRYSLIARKGTFGQDESAPSSVQPAAEARSVQAVDYDVYEDARILLALIDLPGVTPETVTIHLSSVALHVSGSTPDDPKRQSPIHSRTYEAVIDIPRGTEADSVDALLSDGVLRLRISKPDSAARRVDILHETEHPRSISSVVTRSQH